MKITPHASNAFPLMQKNNKESRGGIQDKTRRSEDSLVLSHSVATTSIKELNKSIGALQILGKSLEKLDANAEQLLSNSQDRVSKKEIQNTLAQSTFDGKRVFDEDFRKLSQDIRLDSQSLKKQAAHLDNQEEIQKFSQNIKMQKNFAKQAIAVLQNDLHKQLKTTEKNHTKLDKQMLQSQAFKQAHNLDQLSLDKVSSLLA